MMFYSRSKVSLLLLLLYFMNFFSLVETQKHFTETYLFTISVANGALSLFLFSAFINFPSRKREKSSIVPMKWNRVIPNVAIIRFALDFCGISWIHS